MRPRILSEQSGFTLIEVLVASIVLAVGIFGTVALVDGSNQATAVSLARDTATNVGRELVENARLVPYTRATTAQLTTELQARPGMGDAKPGEAGWQLERRGRTYTIEAGVCSLDDPKDGVGEHDASFCADSPAAGTADGNAKDYKRATMIVRWTDVRGNERTLRQSTFLTSRGTADLPKVTQLNMTSPLVAAHTASPPPTITSNVSTAQFSVQTSTVPTGVSWLIDGGIKGLATGGGTGWSFNWPLTGKPDGTYQVGAQPYDAGGQSGPATEMTVKLNRFAAAGPTPLYAGYNVIPSSGGQRRVDVEWFPNDEKDVLGYRVYWQYASASNVPTGTPTQVCPTAGSVPNYSTPSSCSWTMPGPGGSDEVKLNVWVKAVDKDGGSETLREGASSAVVDAYQTNNPPNEPSSLNNSTPGNGTVVLTWNPSTGDPDTGDKVIYYRIFRKAGSPPQLCNGQTPYDRTPFETGTEGTTRQWVDAQPLTGTATYAVCAVDSRMRMSTPPTQTTLTYP